MNISIKNLNVSYDDKIVLEDLSLRVEPAVLTAIVGPNGAGKSTFYKAILGLIEPNTGEISFGGDSLEKVKKLVAYVPQKDGVNWEFPATAMDVVLMGRYPHKSIFQRLNKKDFAIAEQSLADLGMSDFMYRQIGELSGGQQQRVFIARALCQKAEVLLLDEPFVGVDVKTEEKIIEMLKKLASQGKTILVIHHDLSKIKSYFDHIVLLNKKVIAAGPVDKVFSKENINITYEGRYAIF